ncbi:FtsW/RodA/SpoVE family cell cycle protein [Sporanaerobium hydrogeniformans]|uniref:FtsW/RodA/SpoVE family cell cycle protein n=1 Tax=Sporanaerobium hydrogeniformans TaxID=3072179 RepID=UPI00117B7D9B|nr:FtsW/RodA/SpoVE family cell cycle protein [Sporanaerobium hydrogeniformans]
MNQSVSEFIGDILQHIKYKKIHPYVVKELEDHIESLREDYEREGLDKEAAYLKAIEQMGDATPIGKGLHEMHKPKCEWSLIVLFTLLISIGLLALGVMKAHYPEGYGNYYLSKQLIFVILGSLGFWGCYFSNYKKLENNAILFYLIGIGIMIYNLLFGVRVNGVNRYLRVLFFTFSAIRLSIPFLVIGYIGFIRKWTSPKLKNVLTLGVLGGIPICLMMIVSSIKTGLLLGVVFTLSLTFHIIGKEYKGTKIKALVTLYGTLGAVVGLTFFRMIYGIEYRIERLRAFFNPEEDPLGYGYMYHVLKNIRENASVIGGEGLEGSLPAGEITTDMIFTFIVGSMGWLMGIVLMSVIALVIIRLFRAAMKIQESYGRLLTLSISTLFALQFIFNIAMNLGYTPIVGVGLPLVSYGGTALIVDMALLGLFMNVYRRKDLVLIMSQTTIGDV